MAKKRITTHTDAFGHEQTAVREDGRFADKPAAGAAGQISLDSGQGDFDEALDTFRAARLEADAAAFDIIRREVERRGEDELNFTVDDPKTDPLVARAMRRLGARSAGWNEQGCTGIDLHPASAGPHWDDLMDDLSEAPRPGRKPTGVRLDKLDAAAREEADRLRDAARGEIEDVLRGRDIGRVGWNLQSGEPDELWIETPLGDEVELSEHEVEGISQAVWALSQRGLDDDSDGVRTVELALPSASDTPMFDFDELEKMPEPKKVEPAKPAPKPKRAKVAPKKPRQQVRVRGLDF